MKNIEFLKSNGVDVDKSIELFGDLEMYNETMNDFVTSIDEKLNRLKVSYDAQDMGNYAVFAHSIKSDARYLGFTAIAEVALKHEMAGKESNARFISEDYQNLLDNVAKMRQIVNSYLTGEDDAAISEAAPTIETTAEKKRVLVIDDSSLITNLIEKSLSDKYEVVVFNDGIKAKDYIVYHKNEINCLLLDLNMPDISGFEILNYLKDNNLFNTIRTSIITGDESPETIKTAFTYPIVDMLSKPFSTDTLNGVVSKTLNL